MQFHLMSILRIVFVVLSGGILFLPSALGQTIRPQIVVGDFEYSLKYKTHWVQMSETVNVSTPEGQFRFQELQNQGYICKPKESALRECMKRLDNPEEDLYITRYLLQFYNDWQVQFYEPVSEPKLLFNSQFQKEWEIEQKALLGRGVFHTLRYSWFLSEGHRVHFPLQERATDLETPSFHIDQIGNLSQWMTIDKFEGKTYQKFFVEAFLVRIE